MKIKLKIEAENLSDLRVQLLDLLGMTGGENKHSSGSLFFPIRENRIEVDFKEAVTELPKEVAAAGDDVILKSDSAEEKPKRTRNKNKEIKPAENTEADQAETKEPENEIKSSEKTETLEKVDYEIIRNKVIELTTVQDKKKEMAATLAKFGAAKLGEVPEANWPEFYAEICKIS